MSEIEIDKDTGEISVPVWYKAGGMMIRRDSLDPDHPEHTYNYLKNRGVVPENYGIFRGDYDERCEMASWPKERLIAEIFELRKTIKFYEAVGF